MRNCKMYFAALAAVVAMPLSANTAQAATFYFTFDNTPDATVTPPIVGTGKFRFKGPAAAGTYALTSLEKYKFSFTVNGRDFTTADLATPAADVLVEFTSVGSDLSVRFGGAGSGPFGGSLDFMSAVSGLSFQPNFSPLYIHDGIEHGFGTYAGTNVNPAVPEPASWAMLITGLAVTGGALRRRNAVRRAALS